MGPLVVLLLLFLYVQCKVIPVNDANWYFTEWNWHVESSAFAEAVNPGAYFKIKVENAGNVQLLLDFKGVQYPTRNLVTLQWTVDEGVVQEATLPISGSPLQLFSGPKRAHSIHLWMNSRNSYQSWIPWEFVRITGLQVDDDASLSAPTLRPNRLIHYGDSISEGWNIKGNPTDGDSRIKADSACDTWMWHTSASLDAEISLIAWAGQGYTKGGNGGTPLLWTKNGDSHNNAWAWINSRYKREFTKCPQIVTNNHGTNDMSNSTFVPASVTGWLGDFQKACPNTRVIMIPPLGGALFNEISKGVAVYKQSVTASLASNVQVLTLNSLAKKGFWVGNGWATPDGVHPNIQKNAQLAAIVSGAISSLKW